MQKLDVFGLISELKWYLSLIYRDWQAIHYIIASIRVYYCILILAITCFKDYMKYVWPTYDLYVVSVLKVLLIYLFWDSPNIIKRMLWYRLDITVKWWKLGLDWNDLWRTTLRQIHIWKKDLLLLEIFHVLKYVSIVHVEIQPKFYRGKGISTSMRMMFLLMIKIWHKAWLASFYICDFFWCIHTHLICTRPPPAWSRFSLQIRN